MVVVWLVDSPNSESSSTLRLSVPPRSAELPTQQLESQPSYAAWGKPEKAGAVFRELEARSQREYIQPAMLTAAAAAVGEIDQAMVFAQQALDERDPSFVLPARTWPD